MNKIPFPRLDGPGAYPHQTGTKITLILEWINKQMLLSLLPIYLCLFLKKKKFNFFFIPLYTVSIRCCGLIQSLLDLMELFLLAWMGFGADLGAEYGDIFIEIFSYLLSRKRNIIKIPAQHTAPKDCQCSLCVLNSKLPYFLAEHSLGASDL